MANSSWFSGSFNCTFSEQPFYRLLRFPWSLGALGRYRRQRFSPWHSQMDVKIEAKLKKLGIFSIEQALGLGLTQQGLSRLVVGLSALFHYNLVEQVPGHIWIVVPPEKRTSEAGYKLIRTKISMEKCIVFTNGFRIVSLERAVLEGLKLITKIGERSAIKAGSGIFLEPVFEV